MKYVLYTDEGAADRAARVPLKLRFPDRYEEGKGLPPGPQRGKGPRLPAGEGYTTHAVPVRKGRRAGEFFVREAAADVPDKVRRRGKDAEDPTIDDVATLPARGGSIRTRDDFAPRPEPEPTRPRRRQ